MIIYLINTKYSIHFHVWEHKDMLDFLNYFKQIHNFSILEAVENQIEVIFIIKNGK